MSDDPRKAIVGTWRLVHSVEYGPDGTPHYLFGQDAVGYNIYSKSGVMAVQITRRERAEDAQRPAGGLADYLAYFGRYECGHGEPVGPPLSGRPAPSGKPPRPAGEEVQGTEQVGSHADSELDRRDETH
jgi:hypothetical protein